MEQRNADRVAPGQGLAPERMPGHWLLAQMGKRVLRPGGVALTRRMLAGLDIGANDDVVEFAPGLGVTARAALARHPVSYTGVERDSDAARLVRRYLKGDGQQCLVARAEDTGLPGDSATVVYGEAMLTMQTPGHKAEIVREAARLLRPGGRYGVHELCLLPDDLAESRQAEISGALSGAIRVGARPLTPAEWHALLAQHGFAAHRQDTAPMRLLEPGRLLQDEGLTRALRFAWRVARSPEARRRIRAMRTVFRDYADNLAAIAIVAVKQ